MKLTELSVKELLLIQRKQCFDKAASNETELFIAGASSRFKNNLDLTTKRMQNCLSLINPVLLHLIYSCELILLLNQAELQLMGPEVPPPMEQVTWTLSQQKWT